MPETEKYKFLIYFLKGEGGGGGVEITDLPLLLFSE